MMNFTIINDAIASGFTSEAARKFVELVQLIHEVLIDE